jgi:prophage regulatory protein
MARISKEREDLREWKNAKILRERQVRDLTGLSRVTRWRLERRGEFPQKVQLTQRCVGWLEWEVIDWLKTRVKARRSHSNTRNEPDEKGGAE